MEIVRGSFAWDEEKEAENLRKHGVDFTLAAKAFLDPKRKFIRILNTAVRKRDFFASQKWPEEFLQSDLLIDMAISGS